MFRSDRRRRIIVSLLFPKVIGTILMEKIGSFNARIKVKGTKTLGIQRTVS